MYYFGKKSSSTYNFPFLTIGSNQPTSPNSPPASISTAKPPPPSNLPTAQDLTPIPPSFDGNLNLPPKPTPTPTVLPEPPYNQPTLILEPLGLVHVYTSLLVPLKNKRYFFTELSNFFRWVV